MVGFVVAGILVSGGPTPHAARTFFDGLTQGWAAVVSVTQPADLTAQLRVVPFALAWLGALIGCEIARHVRQPAVPIAGPLVTTVLTVLLSAEEHTVALAQGAVVAALGLAVGVIQQRRMRRAGTVVAGGQRRGATGRSVARLAAGDADGRGDHRRGAARRAAPAAGQRQRPLRPARPRDPAVGSAGAAQPARRGQVVARRRAARRRRLPRRLADQAVALAARRARQLRRRGVDRRQRAGRGERRVQAGRLATADTDGGRRRHRGAGAGNGERARPRAPRGCRRLAGRRPSTRSPR